MYRSNTPGARQFVGTWLAAGAMPLGIGMAPRCARVAAHPPDNPGKWVTPNHYPSRAQCKGRSEVTRLHLAIDNAGPVAR